MAHEILTNEQMAAADRLTIARGTAGFTLMRRAGQGAAAIVKTLYKPQAVTVLCGPGNNGGDGYIIARELKDAGFTVDVWSLVDPARLKGDARASFESWGGSLCAEPDLSSSLIIDAVFGTGFNKKLEEPVISILKKIKNSNPDVIAIDIPSGVNGATGAADPAALPARHTITFARKKAGHCLMPGMALCGEIHIVDIGIPDDIIQEAGFMAQDNHPDLWKDRFPHRKTGDHKYAHGHAVVAGAEKMTGATRLAAEACARAGAGLTTVIAPPGTGEIYRRTLAPHVIVEDRKNGLAAHLSDERRNAVLIGPGAGCENTASLQKDVLDILTTSLTPTLSPVGRGSLDVVRTGEGAKIIILDADALNCFKDDREKLYSALNKNCILTPHEGEFARLFPDIDGLKTDRAQEAAERTGAVIVLKGPDTVIAAPGRKPVINTNAPPWLATAGTGDVLAGMIAGLAAQGMEPFDAACAAVWIHGEAARQIGEGLVASDMAGKVPGVIRSLVTHARE